MAFYIQNVKSGLVLDVKLDGDTGKVTLANPTGGPNQLWTYRDRMIYSQVTEGFVLEVNEEEMKVQVYIMNGRENQKWNFDEDRFVKSQTGVVLDIVGGKKLAGSEVIVHQKHGCKNQVFRQIYVTPI